MNFSIKKCPFYFIFLLNFLILSGQAQSSKVNEQTSAFKAKIAEFHSTNLAAGFKTYKGSFLQMQRNTEFPILVELREGNWYRFSFVGDPDAKKIELKLGMEGYGDFITDKFRPQNTNEFWTSFSFICPRSGRYLLTLFQKGSQEKMLAHMSIMQKHGTTNKNLSFNQ